jgi:hypothetical protein
VREGGTRRLGNAEMGRRGTGRQGDAEMERRGDGDMGTRGRKDENQRD